MRQLRSAPNETSSEAFSESIATYDALPDAFAEQYEAIDTHRYIEWLQSRLPSGSSVLDVGSGSGRDAAALASLGYQTIGVDVSTGMLTTAKARHPEVQFQRGDARSLPFDERSFDGVWAMASLVHLEEDDLLVALREFARVLRPGGVAFVSLPAGPEGSWRSTNGYRRWFPYLGAETVQGSLEAAGFLIERFEEAAGIQSGSWINVLARRSFASQVAE